MARKGYDILDKKRQVLVSELAVIHKQIHPAREDLLKALAKAYKALDIAHMEIGREPVRQISDSVPKNMSADIYFRSIMGVEVPLTGLADTSLEINYELGKTTISLDEAVLAWKEALEYIISWGMIENAIHRLKLHIQRTQKRANALGNIVIPKYEAHIKYIEERLEERERDDLARLKLIKTRKRPIRHHP